jgi:hypothetical protein
MPPVQPAPSGAPTAAGDDLLGEAVILKPPGTHKGSKDAQAELPQPTVVPTLPEPPPAEDENQPGFIGERNRPVP